MKQKQSNMKPRKRQPKNEIPKRQQGYRLTNENRWSIQKVINRIKDEKFIKGERLTILPGKSFAQLLLLLSEAARCTTRCIRIEFNRGCIKGKKSIINALTYSDQRAIRNVKPPANVKDLHISFLNKKMTEDVLNLYFPRLITLVKKHHHRKDINPDECRQSIFTAHAIYKKGVSRY